MGQYRFTGDLHEYHITGAAEDLSAEVHIESLTEPWRPATGNIVFGPEGQDIFGWTPAVPLKTSVANTLDFFLKAAIRSGDYRL